MARKVYRVVPAGERWELKHEGDVLAANDTKQPLVEQGQATAKPNQPSQLVVHKKDGTIEYEYTYGDDPSETKG
jgi:hypothetical protein